IDIYYDDVVIGSYDFGTTNGYLSYLRAIFEALYKCNIFIGPNKSFIAFPSAIVLGRMVNSIGISTIAERLVAITTLEFLYTLKDLKYFIGATGFIYYNILLYSILIALL
ncbi:uncharacterized protein THITE_2042370, partial [Thermothielavioides terrestris NRRL 8126]